VICFCLSVLGKSIILKGQCANTGNNFDIGFKIRNVASDDAVRGRFQFGIILNGMCKTFTFEIQFYGKALSWHQLKKLNLKTARGITKTRLRVAILCYFENFLKILINMLI
jgi:hypothetical protein